MTRLIRRAAPVIGALAFLASTAYAQRSFATPEQAATALRDAARAHDTKAMYEIFGPDLKDLLTDNKDEESRNYDRFSHAASQHLAPVAETRDLVMLEVGPRRWPFPIPLVRKDGEWVFDTAAGKDEILDRRIGRNELHAIGFCRRFAASKGKMAVPSEPQFGYLFRRLAEPGSGKSLLAYPESYIKTGIMSFVVDPKGTVYRRDLGDKTQELAPAITRFQPGDDWQIEDESGITFKK